MKKILLANDFTDSCSNALQYATALIAGKDIQIDQVHVFDIPVIMTSSMPHRAVTGLISERQDLVAAQLEEWSDRIPQENRGNNHSIFGPYPAAEIADLANNGSYDMVIMALRQKYSMLDRMIGSVTAQALQLSQVPVLAVPSGARFETITRILFPTSMRNEETLAEPERNALQWFFNFWSVFNYPQVHMVHIETKGTIRNTDITFKNKPYSEIDFTRSYAENVEEGIANFLQKEHAQLLAFYKPHRSFWERLYHSSVTRKLLYKSRTPLLIF